MILFSAILFLSVILQFTGGSYHIIFRNGNAHIKTAKLAVKFSLVKIGHRMPALACHILPALDTIVLPGSCRHHVRLLKNCKEVLHERV